LADFLVFKATGVDTRSTCCAVCKWTFLAHEKEGKQWSSTLFKKIGLEDMFDGGRVGKTTADLGSAAGNLSPSAAAQLGLTTDCLVGVGIIDAHCGGIGILGVKPEETLAIIAGTSSCHMAVSEKPVFVNGVWGPYYGAMLPGFWLSEGGQSAAGSLAEHVVTDSSEYAPLKKEADSKKITVYQLLNEEIL
jgi:ribulose kinase